MSLGLFIVQRVLERHKLLELWGSVRAEREAMFEKILALHTRPLKGFVSDYTFWDDMVEFAARPSKKWAEENIEASMGTFSADAAWVYNQEQKLIYAYFDSEKYPWLKDNLFAPEVLEQIFSRSPIAHFFINISGNLIEVWGATIHPTADVQRQTPGQGYFFCGRVWTPEYLNELALLISSQVILTEGPQKLSKGIDKQGLINFTRELPG